MIKRHMTCLAALLCSACSTPPEQEALQGVWLSNGYGMAAHIIDGSVTTYAVARNTCIREDTIPLRAVLREYQITQGPDPQTFELRQNGVVQGRTFHRSPGLPAACATPRPNSPTGNFEAFVDIFAAHYAFFDLYGVNWDQRADAARRQVHDGMSEQELFAVMQDLLTPLRDGHISLRAEIDGARYRYKPNSGALFERIIAAASAAGRAPKDAIEAFKTAYWMGNVRDTILQGQGTVAGNEFVQYGLARPDVGYIALISVAGYSHGKEDYLSEDIEEIETILDSALVEFAQAGVTAVIVDLSLNFGGYDEAALVIASRFAAAPVVAFSEYPADAQNPVVVQRRVMPSQRPSYTGPLYLVTSNMTVSAAEILTMALRALPQTVHVGSPTRGALSDVLEKELPNGWQINLSNEVYADHEGILWEGRGITPYLSIDVFGGSDPLQSHRRAIAIVLAQIRSDRR